MVLHPGMVVLHPGVFLFFKFFRTGSSSSLKQSLLLIGNSVSVI